VFGRKIDSRPSRLPSFPVLEVANVRFLSSDTLVPPGLRVHGPGQSAAVFHGANARVVILKVSDA